MGIENKTVLVCDRCGCSVDVEEKSCMFGVASWPEGWKSAGKDKALCPECSPHYELLLARHKVEIDNYLNGR